MGFGKGSGSSNILDIILWPGPPSSQALSIQVELTVDVICESECHLSFLWRCWFSKVLHVAVWDSKQTPGWVCVSSSFPWASCCWSRNAGLRMDSSKPPSLTSTSHRNTDVAQKGFVLFVSRSGYILGNCGLEEVWPEKWSPWDCMGLDAAPLGGRVLPHAPLRATSKGAAQWWLDFQKGPCSALMAFCAALEEMFPQFVWNPGESER